MGCRDDTCAEGDPDDWPLGLLRLIAICHTGLSPARLDPSIPVSDPAGNHTVRYNVIPRSDTPVETRTYEQNGH